MFFSTGNSIKRGKEVINNLFFFSEHQMLDCNQLVIVDQELDGEISLFDAGNGASLDGLFEGMRKFNLDYNSIIRVFITHEHIDHVLGLYPLIKSLNEDVEIFAYGETAKILSQGDESKICPRTLGINPSMFGAEITPLKITELKESDTIKIGSDFNFNIYHTPGHSLGSICFYDAFKKILIPGDLVFVGGSFGRYDFPGGSLKTLQNSIEFVNNLDVKYLLPGHMGISENGNQQIELSHRMVQSIGAYF